MFIIIIIYNFTICPILLLQCWNNCAPRSTIAENQPAQTDSSDGAFELSVRSMLPNKSLMVANIEWYGNDRAQHQCLVTWEIFGGGIMGNLLTDTHEAELSLLPNSKYNIQVTCKNKVNFMIKELKNYILQCVDDFKGFRTVELIRWRVFSPVKWIYSLQNFSNPSECI